MTVDPYLVAAKMTEDAALAYHTALEFHGRAYSVQWRLVYVSASKSLPLTYQSHEFRRVPLPPPGPTNSRLSASASPSLPSGA